MVNAWYMDDKDGDQRLPHKKLPNEDVSLIQLEKLGILAWQVNN